MLRKCTEEGRIIILQKPLVWKKDSSFSISVSWDAWFTSQPLSIIEQLISILIKFKYKMSLLLETNSRDLLMHLPYQLKCQNHANWTPHCFESFITASQNSSDRVNNRNVGVLFRTEEADLPKRFISNKMQWVLRFWSCTPPRNQKRRVCLKSIIYFWVFWNVKFSTTNYIGRGQFCVGQIMCLNSHVNDKNKEFQTQRIKPTFLLHEYQTI